MKKVSGLKVVTTGEASELPLPAEIQEALCETVGAAREGLLALSVGVGLGVLEELMAEEVEEVCGPRGKHDPDRVAYRHGSDDGRSRSAAAGSPSSGRGCAPKTALGKVPPSQLTFSNGIGAAVDLSELSAIVLGLDEWPTDTSRKLVEPRLLAAVRLQPGLYDVRELCTPPEVPEGHGPFDDHLRVGVPVAPFPRWLRCPRRRLLAPLESGLFAPARPGSAHIWVHPAVMVVALVILLAAAGWWCRATVGAFHEVAHIVRFRTICPPQVGGCPPCLTASQ